MNQVREVGRGRFGVDTAGNIADVVTHMVRPLPFVKYSEAAGVKYLAGMPANVKENKTPNRVLFHSQDLEENSETTVYLDSALTYNRQEAVMT